MLQRIVARFSRAVRRRARHPSTLTPEQLSVFLIDEIDCADEKFEAFLLEFLSNFQVCILQVCILG
jgi:MoxR-like ATPase